MDVETVVDTHAPAQTEREQELERKRSEAAKKAARTRKMNQAAMADHYAALLRNLREAFKYSERAKQRPANGMTYREYRMMSCSKYTRQNYQASRLARENDYEEKANSLEAAAEAALQCGIAAGWHENDDRESPIPYILYFDLPVGQVSFHSKAKCGLPEYSGEWDRVRDVSGQRIERAIDEFLD